jgi:NitT/TauT family transport system ATP-binding protein
MDEPFSSLDAPTRESLQDLTFSLRAEQNLTLVIVTHAIDEAAILGKKIMVLGQPPNENPVIVDNPQAGEPDFRHSPIYLDKIQELRSHLDGVA